MESTTGKWENAPWTDPRNMLHEWKLLLARWNQCFCWYVYLSNPLCNWSRMVILLYSVSGSSPCNYPRSHKSFGGRGSPSQAHSTNQFCFFGFPPRERETEKKKKKAPPIFATHVLHHWIVVFMSFWIGCVFHCLGRSTREQTAPQNTNYSINFSELCVCVKTGKHTMGLQL